MGAVDEATKEFKEGLISLTMRLALRQKADKYQWLIFDGGLDKSWIENMNSVLDDNKKLALITGESVALDSRTRIVFETDDLSNCSPGTISRCGLLYMDDAGISLKALVNKYT